MHGVQLVPAIAAVLLPLAGHAVYQGLLSAVVQGIDTGIKQALKDRFVGADVGLVRPGELPSPDVDVADRNLARGIPNVQLQPAETFKVKRLEFVFAFAADEAGPGIEMRVQQGRAAGGVSLVDEQFDRGAGRRVNGETGPADYLFSELKGERRRA